MLSFLHHFPYFQSKVIEKVACGARVDCIPVFFVDVGLAVDSSNPHRDHHHHYHHHFCCRWVVLSSRPSIQRSLVDHHQTNFSSNGGREKEYGVYVCSWGVFLSLSIDPPPPLILLYPSLSVMLKGSLGKILHKDNFWTRSENFKITTDFIHFVSQKDRKKQKCYDFCLLSLFTLLVKGVWWSFSHFLVLTPSIQGMPLHECCVPFECCMPFVHLSLLAL